MGAQIALHCANAGVPVAAARPHRRRPRRRASKRARKLKPDPLFTPDAHRLVTTGGFDTDLDAPRRAPTGSSKRSSSGSTSSSSCSRASTRRARPRIDRQLEHLGHSDRRARRRPHRRLPPALARHALLQPAALPAAARAHPDRRDRSGGRRRDRRASAITCSARAWSSRRTRRTSSATTSVSTASRGCCEVLATGKYTIEEIDAITGPALGRPGSATFRTMDIAGIDVLAHVMRNLNERLPTRRRSRGLRRCRRSSSSWSQRGSLGEKAGQGFYKRRKNAAGETRDLDARSRRRSSIAPKQSARIAVDRRRQVDRRRRRARPDAVQRARTRSASSCARRWRRRWSTPRASRRTSRIRSTTSIA